MAKDNLVAREVHYSIVDNGFPEECQFLRPKIGKCTNKRGIYHVKDIPVASNPMRYEDLHFCQTHFITLKSQAEGNGMVVINDDDPAAEPADMKPRVVGTPKGEMNAKTTEGPEI